MIVDAAPPVDAVLPPPAPITCDPGATAVVAPAPEPTWSCARPDGTRHGPFVTLFPGGAIAISGSYKDGALDGTWVRNDPSGALAERGAYASGKKHGTWTQLAHGKQLGTYDMVMGTGTERRWFDDGTLYSEIAFKAGVEHGPAKLYTPDGTLITSSQYDGGKLDGARVVGTYRTLRFEERFARGVRVGKREIWGDTVQIALENYDRRGKLDGAYTLWRRRNVTRVEGTFEHGKRTGAWVWHDRDGNVEREGSYSDGKKTGDWKEYLEGKLAFTGHYTDGKPDGELAYFDRDGNELGRFTMANGTGTMLTFWGNRKVASKTRMLAGVEDGPYQELTPRGKVIVDGRYRGGLKHGVWKQWSPDGSVLVVVQTWKRGKLDGPVKKYVDGKLSLEATYVAGEVAGTYTEHRNGKPVVTGSYASDRKTGTWTHYAADGSVVLVATYKSGVLDGPWRQLVGGSVLEGMMTAGRRTGTWTLTDKAGSVNELVYASP